MKKIALISFVENLNYGGTLQAYALEKYIENAYEDISCEYIKYVKKQGKATIVWFCRKILYTLLRKDDTPSWTIKEYTNLVKNMLLEKNNSNMKENEKLFQQFWELSKYSSYMSRKELFDNELDYDLYIVGSDQVWNCGRLDLDTTYLLDFVKDNEKKASYAPSLSLKSIPEKYRKKYIKYLSSFKYLSCREKAGAKVIKELIDRDVKNVLDPVFLLSKHEWEMVENIPMNMRDKCNFIVVYILDESEILTSYAKTYAESMGMEIVYIYGDLSKNECVGPSEWLWYLRNAKMIFTNSFHGTAFSIIFNVPFWVEVPQKDFFQVSSDRIFDVLKLFELEERLVEKYIMEPENRDIFKRTNIILKNKREEAMQYIDLMIEGEKVER